MQWLYEYNYKCGDIEWAFKIYIWIKNFDPLGFIYFNFAQMAFIAFL